MALCPRNVYSSGSEGWRRLGVGALWEIRYMLAGWALFAIWVISLALPVSDHGSITGPGLYYLVSGWGGALTLQFAWLANPLVMIAILYAVKSRKPKRSIGLAASIALCLLAASATFYHQLPSPDGATTVIPNASGFYLWLVAVLGGAALVLVSSFANRESIS